MDVLKSVFYTIRWICLIFCNLQHKYYWPHVVSIYSSSKQTMIGLDYVDTWEWPWMMQSILRVTGTYMVIKILSMHIPFSLNTALSVPPPSFQRFQVQFFLRLLPCPVAVRLPDLHAYRVIWLVQSAWIFKTLLSLAKGAGQTDYGPPWPGPHPSSRELRTEWN